MFALIVGLGLPAHAIGLHARAGGPYSVDAESSETVDGSASTGCYSGTLTYRWDWDDDGTYDTSWSSGSTATFTAAGYDGPVEPDITLEIMCEWTVFGKTLTETDTDTTSVEIANVAPVISGVAVSTGAVEGTAVSFTVSYSDVEAADTHTVTWDFGDGDSGSGASTTHTYVDDGTYAVVVKVTDDDGDADGSSFGTHVLNAAPVLVGTPDDTVVEGETWSFSPSVTDAGVDDTHTWTATVIPASATLDSASGAMTWSTSASDRGTVEPFTLYVEDDDGGADSLSWTVEVVMLDDDGDGMSDYWEIDNGLDPTDSSDASKDGDGDGRSSLVEYQDGTDPNSYDGPGAPSPRSPTDGGEVADAVATLVVTNATSPVGDALTYRFQLFDDAAMSSLVTEVDGVTEGSGATEWDADVTLTENTWYWWWSAAEDAYTQGAWSTDSSFFYNTVNEAPTAPGLDTPLDGGSVSVVRPELVLDEATDPDQDALTYSFRLTNDAGDTLDSHAGVNGDGVQASWTVSTVLVDNESYCWTAWATDDEGLDGPEAGPACFLVDTFNDPPSAPELLEPADEAEVTTLQPTLRVRNGVDPEGRATYHEFQIDTVDTFSSADLQDASVDSGEDGYTEWTAAELAENTWVYARVRCDDGAAASAWARSRFFVNTVNDPPGVPTLASPLDDAPLASGEALELVNTTDPDEDPLTYDFQILGADDQVVAEGSGVVEGADGRTSWVPTGMSAGQYSWTARAVDDEGLAGEWALAEGVTVEGDPAAPGARDTGIQAYEGVEGLRRGDGAVGCGCASTAGRGAGLWGLLLGLGLAARRRR